MVNYEKVLLENQISDGDYTHLHNTYSLDHEMSQLPLVKRHRYAAVWTGDYTFK